MKQFIGYIAWLCLILSLSAEAETPVQFSETVADLPLMAGFREIKEAGIVFDKPSGRIVEIVTEGDADKDAVLSFYRDTLPQLGWTPVTGWKFNREGESLTLKINRSNAILRLHISIAPE